MADPYILESRFPRKVTLSSGVTTVVGSLLFHDGTNYALADANDQTKHAQLVALQIGTAEQIDAAPYVVLADEDAPFTQDEQQYLSGTAGEITETAPTGASDLIQVVGVAHADDLIEIALRPPQEVTIQMPQAAFLATAAYLVVDVGPAAGVALIAVNDSVQYVWQVPRNCVEIVRATLAWSANITLDASDTYTVDTSSAAAGEANDAVTDSIAAAALTVTADNVAEADISAAFNATGFGIVGDWVHVDIDKAAEGAGGDDPVMYGVALTYRAV